MIDQSQVLKELIRRKKAQETMADFARFVLEVEPARHHLMICDVFERVLEGKLKRAIIAAPPGSAKSTYSSLLAPAFIMAMTKGFQIISCSHTTDLAEDFGRKVKSLVESPEYRKLFPNVMIDDKNNAAGRWSTLNGSSYFAAGVGAGISGRRADLLLIDDPYKNFADANSPAARKKVLDWFYNDAIPRLKPSAAIVVIATRWHEDDLTGRLLEKAMMGGDKYEVLNFQAICENPESDPLKRKYGEALWPGYQDLEFYLSRKQNMPSRDWSALYQQKPIPEEGYMMKKSWFKYFREKPEEIAQQCLVFQSWDTSLGDTSDSDHSVGTTWGKTKDNQFYLLDMLRGRFKFTELLGHISASHQKWKPRAVLIENKNSGRSAIHALERFNMNVIPFNPEKFGGKDMRFAAVTPCFESGRVFLPQNATWRDQYEEELLGYSTPGYKDDIVDSTSQALIWGTGYSNRSTRKLGI